MLMFPAVIVRNRLVMLRFTVMPSTSLIRNVESDCGPAGISLNAPVVSAVLVFEYRYEVTPNVLSKVGSVLNPATARAIVLLKPPIWTTGAAVARPIVNIVPILIVLVKILARVTTNGLEFASVTPVLMLATLKVPTLV